ncbi:hemagglutinin repeat-containing protein [Geothermobacter hydrogeniphilus]|uniref:Filamentous haemagglutinin FhaB/tRNA nuclease CdiA-like TPS domain-containing protein n=1 Tax=Geothermobacter hydrogeniphilus TaxID=1969733 RepID=A0A1X0XXQ5_9BACT|nr:hemagglutinin repeat-containing protein [Geothermobacter hydrogeniphilus]ORJ57694.1 hypothetical protein B5V00_13060 [Geothermobacter hydrogeniphilus]
MKTIHQLLALLLTSALLLQPAVAAAAPIPDQNAEASRRPTLDRTANGLPLVRITAPSADGVSRNQFRSFDIDRKGLIFNNARALTRTELAGYVAGNPNLAGGAARLILNEVTGSDPSALRGFAEIAGRRAELIIANPNGATCDGCGFINTSRATLAVGTPLFDDNGSFSGLQTGAGTLTIGADGLQSEERVDLLARAVNINGAIHAGDLNLVTGVNKIGYPDLTIEAQSGTDKPQLAIDVAALGGMYAGRIRLIGTEDGVGVVNNGTIAAGEDGLTLDSAGHLRLNGRIQSAGGGEITATGIAQSGVLYAADDLQLLSGKKLNNTGVIAAAGDLTISAGHIATSGELAAGCADDGRIGSAGSLSLSADDLVNGGSILFGDSLRATVNGTLDNRNGLITTSAAGRMNLEAQRIDNRGGLIDGGRVKISVYADIDNSGGKMLATDLLSIRGTMATIDNSNGGLGAGQLLSLSVAALDNTDGLLAGDSDLQLQSGTLTGSGRLLAGGRADITLSGDYSHPLDSLLQAAELRLTVAGRLNNAGILTGQSLQLQVGRLDNLESGRVRAADLDLRAEGKILNLGRIDADRLLLSGDSVENRATLLGDRLHLRSGTLDNLGPQAVIAATDSLELDGDQLNNRDRASIFSLGDIRISGRDGNSPSERLLNEGALIEADRDLSVSTVQLDNRRARVEVDTELVSSEQRQLGLYQGYDLAEEVYDCFHGGDAYDCGTWPEVNHYRDLRTINIAVTDILEHDPERKFIRFLGPVSHIGQETVCNPDLETGGGCSTRDKLITETLPITAWYDDYSENDRQATLDYYPEYDPGRDIHPGREISVVLPAKGDLTVHNETARTVTTTVREDRFSLVSPQPRILAGNDMELRIGTGFDNLAGLVSAGENLVVNGTSFKGDTTVAGISNRGFELHRVTREEKISTVEWHDSCDFGTDPHCGNNVTTWSWPPSETVTVIDTLPGEILAGNRLSIFAGSLDNSPLPDNGHPLTGSTLGADLPSPAGAADGTGPRLNLPQNGLFSIIPDPDRPYLVESDPRFTDYGQFLSSDYLLGRLGITPEETRKRLGDGFYEQRLVHDQLAAAPRPRPGNKSDGTARFRQLMDAGIAAAEELRLAPGIALSDEQVAALSHDIVWLVEQRVDLPDGGSETVWAPRVYLARLQPDDLQPDGALLAAGKVEIRTLDEFRNGGTVTAGEDLRITAGRADTTGALSSLADLRLRTSGDLRVHSGTIRGGRVSLKSGGDLVIDTAANEIGSTGDSARSRSTLVGRRGRIESAGDLRLQSEGDLEINAAELDSGGRTRLESVSDLRLGTLAAGTETSSSGRRFSYRRQQKRQLTSQLKSGSDLQLLSSGKLDTQGAELDAGGNLALIGDRGVRIDTVRDRNETSRHVRGRRSGSDLEIADETVHGSRLAAGQDLLIASAATDADAVAIRGSSLQTGETGTLRLITPGGIRVDEAHERHDYDYHDDQRTHSLFTHRARSTDSSRHADLAVGSDLSGGRVELAAGKDLLVRGSEIAGSGDVQLSAGEGLNITTADNFSASFFHHSDEKSGVLSNGSLSVTLGQEKQHDLIKDQGRFSTGSLLGSIEGNLNLLAGEKLTIKGASLIADGSMNLQGESITITPGENITQDLQRHSWDKSGLSIGLEGAILSTASTISAQAKRAAIDKNVATVVRKLKAAQTVLNLRMNRKEIKKAAGSIVKKELPKGIVLNLSAGSQSKEDSSYSQKKTILSSQLEAGDSLRINATGNNQHAGDIRITGTMARARDIELSAARDISLESAQEVTHEESRFKSSGWSLGTKAGLSSRGGGVGLFAEGNLEREKTDGQTVKQIDSVLTAVQSFNSFSGGDTRLAGARIEAGRADIDVSGDLFIQSRQSSDSYLFNNKSMGGSLQLPIGTGAGTGGLTNNRMHVNSQYRGVENQSGIFAGNGGFHINVAESTSLEGGAIVSTAVPENNLLKTTSLQWQNLENYADLDSRSTGLTLDTEMLTSKYDSVREMTHALTTSVQDDGKQNSTTYAVVSQGTIETTEAGDIEGLRREASGSHEKITAFDGASEKEDLKDRKEVRDTVFQVATMDIDEARRVMFKTDPKLYKVVCREEPCTFDFKAYYQAIAKEADKLKAAGMSDRQAVAKATETINNTIADDLNPNRTLASGAKNIQFEEVRLEDIPAGDNMILGVNGIMNGLQRAGELVIQNSDVTDKIYIDTHGKTKKDAYLMYYEESNGLLSEWLIAGYEKHLAGSLGYSNYDYGYADMLETQGQNSAISLAHSRGTLVQRNALEILAKRGVLDKHLQIKTRGAPLSSSQLQEMSRTVSPDAKPDNYLMPNDFVGTLIGFQPGDTWSSILEVPRMLTTANSAHSCYGSGAVGCDRIEKGFSYQDIGKTPAELNRIRQANRQRSTQPRTAILYRSSQP